MFVLPGVGDDLTNVLCVEGLELLFGPGVAIFGVRT